MSTLKLVTVLLVVCLISCNNSKVKTNTRADLASGSWISDRHILIINKDKSYKSITYDCVNSKFSIVQGKWMLTDFKIFEYDIDIPHKTRVTVWRKKIPNEPNTIQLKGNVYKMGCGEDESDYIYFSHDSDKEVLIFDQGDYTNTYQLLQKSK